MMEKTDNESMRQEAGAGVAGQVPPRGPGLPPGFAAEVKRGGGVSLPPASMAPPPVTMEQDLARAVEESQKSIAFEMPRAKSFSEAHNSDIDVAIARLEGAILLLQRCRL